MSWNHKLYERHLQTRRFGRECMWFDEMDSTNLWMNDHLEEFAMSGGVVVCDHQLRGRGRFQRSWYDRSGACLLFSVILRHSIEALHSGLMSLLPPIAIAECLTLRAVGRVRVSLKWPNDVLLNGRKVAGILGQNFSSERRSGSIVGVGLNLDLTEADFPPDIRDKATSLRREDMAAVPREVLLAEILLRWESLFDEYLDGNTRDICERWEQFGPERGSRIVWSNGQESEEGYFAGLGDRGQMRVHLMSEKIIEVFSGDVQA